MDNITLAGVISKLLLGFEAVEVDILHPDSPQNCYISKVEGAPQKPTYTKIQLERHPRLFLESSGLIGLGPASIRDDDILVQFANCDVAALIRQTEDQFKYVGRAVVAKRFDEEDKRVSPSSPELFQFNVPEVACLSKQDEVFMDVDGVTLQILTCPVSKQRREFDFTVPT